jgi:hypothetical protein
MALKERTNLTVMTRESLMLLFEELLVLFVAIPAGDRIRPFGFM